MKKLFFHPLYLKIQNSQIVLKSRGSKLSHTYFRLIVYIQDVKCLVTRCFIIYVEMYFL